LGGQEGGESKKGALKGSQSETTSVHRSVLEDSGEDREGREGEGLRRRRKEKGGPPPQKKNPPTGAKTRRKRLVNNQKKNQISTKPLIRKKRI